MKNKLLIMLLMTSSSALAKDDLEVKATGALTALSSTSVTVSNLTCVVNSSTEFENAQSIHISASAFTVGERVELKCVNGVAKSIEKTSSSTSSDDNGKSSSDDNKKGDDNSSNKNGSTDKSTTTTKIRANLSPATTAILGSGKVSYELKANSNNSEERLQSELKIPTSDGASAKLLKLSLQVSRTGVPYALCNFRFDEMTVLKRVRAAEYKIDARIKRNSKSKTSCDINLVTEGVQSGVPSLAKGDTFTVLNSTTGEVLYTGISG